MEKINWWWIKFDNTEIANVTNAIQNGQISQGKLAEAFESKLADMLNVKYAVSATSGTSALYLALFALGVGAGDEVIVPDRTWVATAHAAYMLGARIVLVDTRQDLPVMDVDKVEEKITDRTKVIIPVHINGRACDMDKLNALASKYNIKIVEDAAQAIFSKSNGEYLGTKSDVGCFSFAMSKLITTGQGGMVVTNDEALRDKLRLVKNHGVIDNFTEAWGQPGMNFKFTDVLAAIGLAQLEKVSARIKHVNIIYEMYREGLKNIECVRLCPVAVEKGELPVWVEALSSKRDALVHFLRERGVQARPCSPALHTSPYFSATDNFPNATRFVKEGLHLPCGPNQPLENIEKVLAFIKEYDKSKVIA
ncbi:MAG TPA: DegT/DnrJ/EryC1/StrS family aminotransferase [Gammaproteobacteria bacterium]|nr:DegT/DnrJ/EryC1/StrS family aminotransferase [Gammaproteobacteria bacterium]